MTSEELLKALTTEVEKLRKIVWFQRAQIEATQSYAAARIADLSGENRSVAFKAIEQLTKEIYDKQLAQLEDLNPAAAARVDIRADLGSDAQLKWYLPRDPEP